MLVLLVFDTYDTHDNRARFEYLYAKYKDLLVYKAWDVLRDHMLAEDAVSEAFIRVLRNMHKIDDPDSPRCAAFLVTITRNCALTLLARHRREATGATEDMFDELPDTQDVEQAAVSSLAAEEVFALLGQVDELSRNIFILKYAYDLPHAEIAAQMGLTENNVTVRLHRTRKKLYELATASKKEG